MTMGDLAKILIFTGAILIAAGVIFLGLGKLPGIGRLPGDILIKKGDFTFYFPVITSVLVSILLSLILFLWNRK